MSLAGLSAELMQKHWRDDSQASLTLSVLEVKGLRPRKGVPTHVNHQHVYAKWTMQLNDARICQLRSSFQPLKQPSAASTSGWLCVNVPTHFNPLHLQQWIYSWNVVCSCRQWS